MGEIAIKVIFGGFWKSKFQNFFENPSFSSISRIGLMYDFGISPFSLTYNVLLEREAKHTPTHGAFDGGKGDMLTIFAANRSWIPKSWKLISVLLLPIVCNQADTNPSNATLAKICVAIATFTKNVVEGLKFRYPLQAQHILTFFVFKSRHWLSTPQPGAILNFLHQNFQQKR